MGQIWRKLHEPVYPITYLQRSNRGVIKKTFELMTKEAEEKTGRTIRVLGGVKKLNFQQIVELFLMKNFPPYDERLLKMKNRRWKGSRSFEEIKVEANKSEDEATTRLIDTMLAIGPAVLEMQQPFKDLEVNEKISSRRNKCYDITVGTVHQAKGLESDNVSIGNDFLIP